MSDPKHGGSRPRVRADDARGGARLAGPGKKHGPTKKRIHLNDAASAHLRRIWRARSIREPGLTEDGIVNAAVLALAEEEAEEWEGEIL